MYIYIFLLYMSMFIIIMNSLKKAKRESVVILNDKYTLNKCLLTSWNVKMYLYMYQMHLKQPVFRCSGCEKFTKHKKRIQNFKGTENFRYIYRNQLCKARSQPEIGLSRYQI